MTRWLILLLLAHTLIDTTPDILAQTEWRPLATGTASTLRSVAFGTTGYGWAVGDRGTIIGSTNSGATWSTQAPARDGHLCGVVALGERQAVAVGTLGSIARTTNGHDWALSNVYARWSLAAIGAATSQVLVAVGCTPDMDSSVIIRSTDGGVSWSRITDPAPERIAYTSVDFFDAMHGVAIGSTSSVGLPQRLAVLTTTDGGQTWTHRHTGTDRFDARSVQHLSKYHMIAFGTVDDRSGRYFVSVDGGTTWQTVSHASFEHVEATTFYSNRRGVAVGWRSKQVDGQPALVPVLMATADGGYSWAEDDMGTGLVPLCVAYVQGESLLTMGVEGKAVQREITCDLPAVTRPLPNSREVALGGVLMFDLGVEDTLVHAKWFRNGAEIPGWDEPMFSIYRVRLSDAGRYQAVVTNDCGSVETVMCEVLVQQRGVVVATRPSVHIGSGAIGETKSMVIGDVFRNEGTLPVRVRGVRVVDAEPDIIVDSTSVADVVLQPGEYLHVPVRFVASMARIYSSSLQVMTENDIHPTVIVTAAGILSVQEIPIRFAVDAIDFGMTETGSDITVGMDPLAENMGTEPSVVTSASIINDESGVFSVDSVSQPLPYSLAPGVGLGVRVRFTAKSGGLFRATLSLHTTHGRIYLPVFANVYEAEGGVVNMGSAPVGQVRDTVLTFHHEYDKQLTVSGMEPLLAPFTVVSVDPPLPAMFGGYDELKVRIRFDASEVGAYAVPVRVNWSDPSTEGQWGTSRRVLRAQADATSGVVDAAADVRLYPMPVYDILNVELQQEAVHATVDVHTLAGVFVSRTYAQGRRISVACDGLVPGMYTIAIDANGRVLRRIFMVQ